MTPLTTIGAVSIDSSTAVWNTNAGFSLPTLPALICAAGVVARLRRSCRWSGSSSSGRRRPLRASRCVIGTRFARHRLRGRGRRARPSLPAHRRRDAPSTTAASDRRRASIDSALLIAVPPVGIVRFVELRRASRAGVRGPCGCSIVYSQFRVALQSQPQCATRHALDNATEIAVIPIASLHPAPSSTTMSILRRNSPLRCARRWAPSCCLQRCQASPCPACTRRAATRT